MCLPGAWPESDLETDVLGRDPREQSSLNTSNMASKVKNGGEAVVIAVMGVTGAGKSTFIQTVTGQDAGVGDSLTSGRH